MTAPRAAEDPAASASGGAPPADMPRGAAPADPPVSADATTRPADTALVALDGPAADAVFSALADPTRRRLLARLARRPDDAGSAAAGLGISRQAVAKHVRQLEGAGLVRSRAEGRRRVHEVDPARIREVSDLLGLVARGWDRRLADLARRAEAAAAGDGTPAGSLRPGAEPERGA